MVSVDGVEGVLVTSSISPTPCSEPKLQRINNSGREDEVWDYTGGSKATTGDSAGVSGAAGASGGAGVSGTAGATGGTGGASGGAGADTGNSEPMEMTEKEEDVFFKVMDEQTLNSKSLGEL